jgi:predicted alpha/beta-fold hydrolase
MARKPKPPTEAAKPSDVTKVISTNKLKNLLKEKRAAKKDTAEIAGALGQKIANAVESDHLHRKAFNVISQLDMMEAEKIRDFLDNFEYYLDVSGIKERADAVNPMDLGENVHRLERPESVAAE